MATENTPTIINKKQLFMDWVLLTFLKSAWAPVAILFYYWIATGLGLFRWFPSLDNPSHVVGGILITYFFRSAIVNSQKLNGNIPKPVQILFAFTCAGTTTILWEFYENILDMVFNMHVARSLRDTLGDLFFGLLGAFILSIFYSIRSIKKSQNKS